MPRWMRLVLALLAAAVLGFVLSNLWLAMPPGRGWVSAKLGRVTGLQITLRSAAWSPWRGVTLRGAAVVMELPEGREELMRIERLVVRPRWKALLRGRLAAERIEVDGPQASVPVELLLALIGQGGTAAPDAPPPALAVKPEEELPPEEVVEEPAAGPPLVVVPADERESVQSPDLPPTTWVIVRDGALRVRAGAGRPDWLTLEGIEAEIPVRGKAASGRLRIAGASAVGESVGGVEIPLAWQAPVLSAVNWRPECFGVRVVVGAQFVPAGTCPFAITCVAPEQSVKMERGGDGGCMTVERAVGVARFVGHARMAASWQGDAALDFDGAELAGVFGRDQRFDSGRVRARLRGGGLRVSDVRVVGEGLSLLGNGILLGDGRLAAVLRVVVPEDAAQAVLQRSALLARIGFRPLVTRDRWFVDCWFDGQLGAVRVRAGGGEPRPLEEWLVGFGG